MHRTNSLSIEPSGEEMINRRAVHAACLVLLCANEATKPSYPLHIYLCIYLSVSIHVSIYLPIYMHVSVQYLCIHTAMVVRGLGVGWGWGCIRRLQPCNTEQPGIQACNNVQLVSHVKYSPPSNAFYALVKSRLTHPHAPDLYPTFLAFCISILIINKNYIISINN